MRLAKSSISPLGPEKSVESVVSSESKLLLRFGVLLSSESKALLLALSVEPGELPVALEASAGVLGNGGGELRC
jgi:hypothetical protein